MSKPDDEPQAPSDDTPFTEILQHHMASIERQVEEARRTLAVEVIPALLACGVANIEVAYSGYGDSGAIDGVQFRDKAGLRVDRNTLPGTLTEKLETAVYSFLPAGFENNEGGQGTVLIDLLARKITLQHQENEVVSNDSTREWEV